MEENPLRSSVSGLLSIPIESMQLVFLSTKSAVEPFISLTLRSGDIFSFNEPIVVNIRVNAGFIPKEHWVQNAEIGGGRIIGEVCHFVDLMQYFTNSEPVKVYADCIQSNNIITTAEDNIAIVIKFSDGSVGNLTYVSNGSKNLPKELIEVFGAGKIGIINDFRSGIIYGEGKNIKLKGSGKGQRQEVYQFLQAVKEGSASPIDFGSICLTTLTTFKIIDSLKTGLAQEINL